MRVLNKLAILVFVVSCTASMAMAVYVIAPPLPNNGAQQVNTNPTLRCGDLVTWGQQDAPIINGQTIVQNVPMGTIPNLVGHQFQSGWPQILQASVLDDYTFQPALPAGQQLKVVFTFSPAAGPGVGTTTTFNVK